MSFSGAVGAFFRAVGRFLRDWIVRRILRAIAYAYFGTYIAAAKMGRRIYKVGNSKVGRRVLRWLGQLVAPLAVAVKNMGRKVGSSVKAAYAKSHKTAAGAAAADDAKTPLMPPADSPSGIDSSRSSPR